MADRRADTMKLSGNDYAKVAERMRLFRQDWPKGKSETEHTVQEDGSVVFKAWLWKDKDTLLDLMKNGVTDQTVLRASSDADGDAKGPVGVKVKDFEKLQTIAVGRALALLGYLGSGEIASFEEMAEFEAYRSEQKRKAVQDAIEDMEEAETLDALKIAFVSSGLMQEPDVVAAKDKRKAELTKELNKAEGAKNDTAN